MEKKVSLRYGKYARQDALYGNHINNSWADRGLNG